MAGKTRVYSLDYLRLFACLCILIIHFNATVSGYFNGMFVYANSITPNLFVEKRLYLGDIGVSIFFMLTGASLMISTGNWDGLKYYYKKRIKAIYPAFYLIYFIVTSFDFIRYKTWNDGDLKFLIPSMLGFDGYIGLYIPEFYTFYKVGEWFLGCLLILYLIFPFLRYLFLKNDVLTVSIVFAFYFLYQILARNIGIPAMSTLFYLRIPELVLGMLFVKYNMRNRTKQLLCGACLFFLICFVVRNNISNMTLNLSFCILLSSIVIFLAEYIVNDTINKKVSYVAGLTYPAFLIHHWLITLLIQGMDLQSIRKREIILLFIIYLVVTISCSVTLNGFLKKIKRTI